MPAWQLLIFVIILMGMEVVLRQKRLHRKETVSADTCMNHKEKKILYNVLIFALVTVALAMGYIRCNNESCIRMRCEPYMKEGADIQLQGEIYKKECKNQQLLFYLDQVILRVDGKQFSTHSTIVTFEDGDYPIGKTITINGSMKVPASAANDGNYDARAYYHSLNIDYLVQGESVFGVYGKTDWIAEKLWHLKEKLKENYKMIFPDRDAGILVTMLLGEKELLDQEAKQIYQQAGVSHILTISGLHLSLLGMAIYRLLRRRASFTIAGVVSSVVLGMYVCMVGAGISAKRAFIMFLLMVLGKMLGRTYDSLTGLSVAVLFLLWENPFLVFHAGFQFSVAAVLGATWVRADMERILSIGKCRWKKVWEALLASVAIQLMTLPLVAFYYYEIPMYAVLLNILVANMLSVILIFGITCGILGFVSVKLAGFAAAPLGLILHGITGMSSACLKLPGAVYLVGGLKIWRMIGYYMTLYLALLLLLRFRRTYEELKESAKKNTWISGKRMVRREDKDRLWNRGTVNVQREEKVRVWDVERFRWEKRRLQKRLFAAGILAVSIMQLLIMAPEKNQLLCAVLDVGQGDGIYLQPGENVHVFIDGGSSDVSKVGRYRMLPFLKYHRVTSIDYWFVSHYDSDHVSGLIQLLEEDYRVENLCLPYEEPDNENYQQLMEIAEKSGTKVVFFSAGSRLEIGSCIIRALLPDPNRSVDAGDANENCMVLYVTHPDGNMVFTGDAGAEDERWILSELAPVKLLKVGHHGSKYSSSEEFLQVLSPEYAVISCSSTNRYGHPHQETLNRLEDAGAKVLRTDEVGAIEVLFQDDAVVIAEYGKKN